jgi:hypothetical protein
MSEREAMPLTALEAELVELGRALAFPVPSSNFAAAVGERIRARPRQSWFGLRPAIAFRRPVSRAVLIAIALLLVVVAVAAAIGFGLPGLKIIFGGPGAPSPSPVESRASPSGAPGSGLGLGTAVPLGELDAQAGFHVLLPTDPTLGAPDAAYIDRARNNQVALVWRPRASLPPTVDPGVGLLLMQFEGRLDQGFFTKSIDVGTTVEPVRVSGLAGYWVSGDPHFFFYTDRNGQFVDDPRRWVGDALLWSDGALTHRLETGLGRDAAIRIAESLR